MIELRHLRHLKAVAQHRSLQAAADAIHLTQPALTKSIARFEEELGASLFDRRGRRLVLTELGERMVARGEDLLRHVRELEEEVELWKGLGTGDVALGVGPFAELGLLPDVLARFVADHPAVRVRVRSGHTGTLIPALLAGELHFVVTDQELAELREDLEIHPLERDPIGAAVGPAHPLARRRRLAFADLAGHPAAGASQAPRFARWAAERFRREGLDPAGPGIVCDNYEVLVRLAEQTDCIVFGPRRLLDDYVKAGRLKHLALALEAPESGPSLIRSRGRCLSPAAERFMELFGA